MTIIESKHVGQYRINLTYLNNYSVNITDVPAAQNGMGEFPSPTALLAEALAACALTTACMAAERRGINAQDFRADVENIEYDSQRNAVEAIVVRFHFNKDIAEDLRPRLEASTLRGCTVGNSLTAQKTFLFEYDV